MTENKVQPIYISTGKEYVFETPESSSIMGCSNIDLRSSDPKDIDEIDTYKIKLYPSHCGISLAVSFCHTLFGPLSIPLLYKLFGKTLLENMLYRFCFQYFYIEFIYWVWTFVSIIIASHKIDYLNQVFPVIGSVGIIIILRIILVSLKYGYFCKADWENISRNRLSSEEIKQSFLINSWIRVPKEIASKELLCAFKRQLLNVDELRISMSTVYYNDFCMNISELCDSEDSIALLDISSLLVKESNKSLSKSSILMVFWLSVIYTCIPFCLISYRYGIEELFSSVVISLYILLSMIPAFLLCSNLLLLTLAGVYDFDRKKTLMKLASSMISLYGNFGMEGYPKLDRDNVRTLLSWYHMRTALLDFGKRFSLRVFLYSSLFFPLCVISIIIIILEVLGIIGTEMNYYLIPGMYLVTIEMALLCAMFNSAFTLNKFFSIHRDLLLVHISELNRILVQGGEIDEDVVPTLEFIIKKLDEDEKLRPITVLGITIDSSFITKLLGLVLIGIFGLLKVMFA